MTYKDVDIKITIDEIIEKLLYGATIEFKVDHTTLGYIEQPFYDDMREQMKEDEMWSDLQELDYSGKFPPLVWKDDSDLIMEIINSVEEGYLKFNNTQINFIGKETLYLFGSNNNLKIKTIYQME